MALEWIGGIAQAISGLTGAGVNLNEQRRINRENKEMAYDFAKNSLSWKVDDARRAGISPLVALGASGYSAPTLSGGQADFDQVGQGLSQALAQNDKEVEELNKGLLKAQVENQNLENAKLRKEIAQIGMISVGPAQGTATLPGTGIGKTVPLEDELYLGPGDFDSKTVTSWDGKMRLTPTQEADQEGIGWLMFQLAKNYNERAVRERARRREKYERARGLLKPNEGYDTEWTFGGNVEKKVLRDKKYREQKKVDIKKALNSARFLYSRGGY